MTTFTAFLPETLTAYLQAQLDSGEYSTADAYIQALIQQDKARKEHLEPLLLEGLESGKATPMTAADWKKISYSKDVDALLVELSEDPIAYAEQAGQVILHYSEDEKLVLVEILDFRRFLSEEAVTELLAS